MSHTDAALPLKSCTETFRTQLVALLPNLRAFAMSLLGNRDRADDLTQETILKAWSHMDSFAEGTNLQAWLFTIMRNTFISQCRREAREVPDPDDLRHKPGPLPLSRKGTSICKTFIAPLRRFRLSSARHSSWLPVRASHTKRPQRSLVAPSVPLRAASIGVD